MQRKPVLVVGATGYVGARLVPHLLSRGFRVRAAGRSPGKLKQMPWLGKPGVEPALVNVFDRSAFRKACDGCSAAFYLVHSMNPAQPDFSHADREAASNMTWAAESSGIGRVVYLGGLGEEESVLSRHLRSREEVGRILQSGRVPATVLRAAMIIGSGSASFEILRYLVDRLPFMIIPRWVDTESQPIPIRNVLGYLSGCLEVPATEGRTFDIGGADVVTYRRLMEIYAEEAMLPKRRILPVPVLTPRLSSYWIHLVTPVPSSLARPLAEGLSNRVVCKDHSIRDLVPQELLGVREAIRIALANSRGRIVWAGAGAEETPMPPEGTFAGDPQWAGGTIFCDRRRVVLEATPEEVWEPIGRIGGRSGWYYGNWLWQARGAIDRLLGGTGMRKGRRSETALLPGDPVDFWRVRTVSPGKILVLTAEMKMPGCAALVFRIRREGGRTVELEQASYFIPSGLWGILYWSVVNPFHRIVFRGLLRAIAHRTGKPVVRGPEVVEGGGSRRGEGLPRMDAA